MEQRRLDKSIWSMFKLAAHDSIKNQMLSTSKKHRPAGQVALASHVIGHLNIK